MSELNLQTGLASEIRIEGLQSLDWDYQHQRDCNLVMLDKAFQKKEDEKKEKEKPCPSP